MDDGYQKVRSQSYLRRASRSLTSLSHDREALALLIQKPAQIESILSDIFVHYRPQLKPWLTLQNIHLNFPPSIRPGRSVSATSEWMRRGVLVPDRSRTPRRSTGQMVSSGSSSSTLLVQVVHWSRLKEFNRLNDFMAKRGFFFC